MPIFELWPTPLIRLRSSVLKSTTALRLSPPSLSALHRSQPFALGNGDRLIGPYIMRMNLLTGW
jgi:hypothetical protein